MLLVFGNFALDQERRQLLHSGTSVPLEPKAFELLNLLVVRRPRVLSKAQIRDVLWPGTSVGETSLPRLVTELRQALGDDVHRPRFIRTAHGFGYAFCGEALEDGQGTETEAGLRAPALAEGAASPMAGERRLGTTARQPRRLERLRRLVLASSVLLGTIAGGLYWLTRSLPAPRITRSIQLTSSGDIARVETHREVFPSVVSDGARVYFTQTGTNSGPGLSFVSVTGGEVGAIAVPWGIGRSIADISPDRTQLLIRRFLDVRAEPALWMLPTTGGALRRVGDVVAHAATWSPDGERIFFAHGHDLVVGDNDGNDRRKLVTLPARAFWLRVSPDGRVLRFTLRDAQTDLTLWEVNTDGTGLHPLLPRWHGSSADCCGNWTPDGRHFVFESDRGGRASIWALREGRRFLRRASGEPTQLTTGPFDFHMPVASTDGRKLFAVGDQSRGESLKYESHSRQFVPFLPGIATGDLHFSRDGNWVSEVDQHWILWRMKADGSQRMQLTSPPLKVLSTHFNWSPDGTRIAFFGKLPGKPWKIYIVSRDGGTPQQLISDERHEADPDWSPDGSSVIFGRLPDYMAEPFMPKAIHILDLRTQNVSTVPGSEGLFSPHWSPDGRYVAAQPMAGGKLLLFDFVTREWVELANRHAHQPTWSRDGRYVYAQDRDGIWRVRVGDRKIETVASPTDLRRPVSSLGFSGLAPDGSPVVTILHSSTDVYALEWELP